LGLLYIKGFQSWSYYLSEKMNRFLFLYFTLKRVLILIIKLSYAKIIYPKNPPEWN
jgi:hypothetical protein